MSAFLGIPLIEDPFYPDYILRGLRSSGLKRVGDALKAAPPLRAALRSFLPVYFDFAKKHWGLDKGVVPAVQKGYGLLFLAHLHILETDYPNDLGSAKAAAQSLVAALKSSRGIDG